MQNVLETEGRVWVRKALSHSDLDILSEASNVNFKRGNRLDYIDLSPKAAVVLNKVDDFAKQFLEDAKSVRLVSFNKTSENNWSLPWHQDRVIAVANKFETKGYYNWTQKAGFWHCEPPIEVLESMMFARVHLDDADEKNGCLEVLIESHKYGKVLSENVQDITAKLSQEKCIAKRGDILFVKALTLHRSNSSFSMSSRRALRIDYSNQSLPSPLEWCRN